MQEHRQAARVAVIMGVSGSGKTTIGRALARRLGWLFQEGDALHPPENVAKMKAGHPLDDRVRDVLRVKFLVGIFDHPYVKDADATEKLVNSAEHQEVALRAARESMVLLKNDKNILPLSKSVKSVTVTSS